MTNKYHKKSTLLFYILIGYILAQISWWIFQIITLSKQIDNSGEIVQHKVKMLAAEFFVFFILLVVGVLFIRRIFNNELKFSERKKNFSLSITHELKTPITTTKLYAEMLLNHQLDTVKQSDIYTKILDEQSRLQRLIEKILLSEKVQHSDLQLELQKVNLSHFVHSIVAKLGLAQEVIVKISQEIEVSIDELYFESVVVNLLENAAKYSAADTVIEIIGRSQDDICIIQVLDQGVAIPEEEYRNIFEVYYRIGNEEERKATGTGVGLYLVRNIVKLHKGEIEVKKNPYGKGNVFEVTLPLYKNEQE